VVSAPGISIVPLVLMLIVPPALSPSVAVRCRLYAANALPFNRAQASAVIARSVFIVATPLLRKPRFRCSNRTGKGAIG